MDFNATKTILSESVPGLTSFLYRHSVAIVKAEDGDELYQDELRLATGTLISIGKRLFVATASHVIPTDPYTRIWILGEDRGELPVSRFEIVNRARNAKDRPDVGFFELCVNASFISQDQEICTIDRIAIQGVGRPSRPILLIGGPGEWAKVIQRSDPSSSEKNSNSIFIPTLISYLTVPLQKQEWPTATLNTDPLINILLPYPETPASEFESGKSINLPNPQGMSGGGLWDQGFEEGLIWSNESSKLFGIFTEWNEPHRYACAVQIIHWLRLIHSHYPDLRPILDGQFPRLAG